jgi:hypothetical protein
LKGVFKIADDLISPAASVDDGCRSERDVGLYGENLPQMRLFSTVSLVSLRDWLVVYAFQPIFAWTFKWRLLLLPFAG